MTTAAAVVFEPLGPEHDRSAFSCGEPALDDYLRRRAAQDVRRRVARAFVALDRASGAIAGYYTLSAASFSRRQLPEAVAKRMPHYPVPAAILGRLAIDQRYQGRGLGELMLADAIKRVLRASEALAVHALASTRRTTAPRRSTSAMASWRSWTRPTASTYRSTRCSRRDPRIGGAGSGLDVPAPKGHGTPRRPPAYPNRASRGSGPAGTRDLRTAAARPCAA